MLNYATVGSNDLPRTVAFYDALLGAYGWKTASLNPDGGRVFFHPSGSLFGVVAPRDGNPATVGNGTMIGFNVASADAVAAFHALAITLGGTDEGAPGNRGDDLSPYHFGYMRDPVGNKLCAYHIPGRG